MSEDDLDVVEVGRKRSKKAIEENLHLILAGDSSLNKTKVTECVKAFSDMIAVIGEAAERFEKNALELRGVFVLGELSQLEQLRVLLAEALDLLTDKIAVAPDLYKRDGTVTFELGQVCRGDGLDAIAGIARQRIDEMRSPGRSLSDVADSFSGVLGGFLTAEVDVAIRVLQEQSEVKNNQVAVVLGQFSTSRLTQARASRVTEIEDIAERSLESIRAAAHGVGVGRLAKDFEAGRNSENKGAMLWTTGVFLCVAAAVSLPLLILSVDTHLLNQVSGPAAVVVKALIGLPFLGLAGYCARIASHHREAARHLAILTTQMDALRAYVTGLPDEDQREITMVLGRRAFSNPDLDARDSGHLNALPDDAVKVLEKAVDLAKDALKRS